MPVNPRLPLLLSNIPLLMKSPARLRVPEVVFKVPLFIVRASMEIFWLPKLSSPVPSLTMLPVPVDVYSNPGIKTLEAP